MDTEMKEHAREVRKEAHLNSAFDKWLAEPMTRMGMSMIPPGDHQDALRLLLRSAFDAGAGAGAGNVAGEFVQVMLEGMMKRDKDKPL